MKRRYRSVHELGRSNRNPILIGGLHKGVHTDHVLQNTGRQHQGIHRAGVRLFELAIELLAELGPAKRLLVYRKLLSVRYSVKVEFATAGPLQPLTKALSESFHVRVVCSPMLLLLSVSLLKGAA